MWKININIFGPSGGAKDGDPRAAEQARYDAEKIARDAERAVGRQEKSAVSEEMGQLFNPSRGKDDTYWRSFVRSNGADPTGLRSKPQPNPDAGQDVDIVQSQPQNTV